MGRWNATNVSNVQDFRFLFSSMTGSNENIGSCDVSKCQVHEGNADPRNIVQPRSFFLERLECYKYEFHGFKGARSFNGDISLCKFIQPRSLFVENTLNLTNMDDVCQGARSFYLEPIECLTLYTSCSEMQDLFGKNVVLLSFYPLT